MRVIRVFRGNKVLVGEDLKPATVVVEDGKITAVHDGLVDPGAGQEDIQDLGDDILMPGLVDCHVHINEPGRTDWEGFTTATKAAAYGGVTTIVDMPLNALPPTTSPENLKTKVEAAEGQCRVNVKFWGGVIPGNTPHLRQMVSLGVPGFKCFLIHSGVDEFPAVDKDQVEEALEAMKGTGAVLLFHAEAELPNLNEDPNSDPGLYSTFLESRPPGMELAAIRTVISVCRKTRVPCHIVHLSAAEALPMIRAAREEGLPLTLETCHHYLNLNSETIPDRATQYKCCPPIRDTSNKEKLWEAVLAGDIDMIVSDHSPCTPDLKMPGEKDFMAAWGGISSLQFGLSLFWTQAEARGLTVQMMNKLLCRAPAKLAKLDHCKGCIKVGYDADFVIWSQDKYHTISVDRIQHKNKITPYLDLRLRGEVQSTLVAGAEVYTRKGGFIGQPRGQLIVDKEALKTV